MKKKFLAIALTVIVLIAAIPITITLVNNHRERTQLELMQAYAKQNIEFRNLVNADWNNRHQYFPPNSGVPTIDGVCVGLYMMFAHFRQMTDIDLTYDMVLDYLSQEFEDDGKIRIFTNGRHPEIAAYLEWIRDAVNLLNVRAYVDMLDLIYTLYADANEGFPVANIYFLPVAMIDELIRKATDIGIVVDHDLRETFREERISFEDIITVDMVIDMNLTSIQNRYIAEGRAIVSEDGKTIEFLVPES